MRPVRLTLQAFGPFAGREVVDFRAALDAGLFGLFGPTGSGKSSIFNGMTFALFGKPAKENQKPETLRSDFAAPDLSTEVEFVFDLGPKRYVVLRRPGQSRPKRRGDGATEDPATATLFDATGLAVDEIDETRRGRVLAEKKIGQVDAEIERLLGYGATQFRQIVLLPQGRFETFLASDTRERLTILRDLFDVSRYRRLMERLKADADAAEGRIRADRAVCAGRLHAEGFETPDALEAGLAAAQAIVAEHRLVEDARRVAVEASGRALALAQGTDALFVHAEAAGEALVRLRAQVPDMDARAARVQDAERAATAVDLERRRVTAVAEAARAEDLLEHRRAVHAQAEADAASALTAWRAESDRAGEITDLRKAIDTLERAKAALEKATDARAEAEAADRAVATARSDLQRARDALTAAVSAKAAHDDALRAARAAAGARQDARLQVAALEAASAAALAHEAAARDHASAAADAARLRKVLDTAEARADGARAAFEQAEQRLAEAQALHLAMKLRPGEPCPVCGSAHHPEPATGTAAETGLDTAFRSAKEAYEKATSALHTAAAAWRTAEGISGDRQSRLAALPLPERTAAVVGADLAAARRALAALGPDVDLDALALRAADFEQGTRDAETLRDLAATALTEAETRAASAAATRDAFLSHVPEALRTPKAIQAAMAEHRDALRAREQALSEAETRMRAAQTALLEASKDVEAAATAALEAQTRLRDAATEFAARLADHGLTLEAYMGLKPALARLEDDKAAVKAFRREHDIAVRLATEAADQIAGLTRPDLDAAEEAAARARAALEEAISARAGAEARHQQLSSLRAGLAAELRRLDEEEARSGPLRALAALANADNDLKLDLETFAIGAMFDQVLDAANRRLGPMTHHRYRLEREMEATGRGRRGLGIQVFDLHTGKARATATLSGGETFIAALALALGLADVVEGASGKVRLDTIFIDEGFGSLDTESGAGTLDQVLRVLGALASANRAVGLISHVPLVQEAVPDGFTIRKGPAGSHVEARSNR